MKKVLLILTTIMLSFMLFSSEVFADNTDLGNANLGGIDASACPPDGCPGGGWDGRTEGIRITIVDANGNRIPGTVSVDYLADTSDKDTVNISNKMYYNKNKGHRKETASAEVSTLFTLLEPYSFGSIRELPGLEGFIGGVKGGFSWPENSSQSYLEWYFDKKLSAEQFREYVLEATGYADLVQVDSNLCRAQPNTYFIIEPLIRILIPDLGYLYGTGTEMIKAIAKYSTDTGLIDTARRIFSLAIHMDEDMIGYQAVLNNPFADAPFQEYLDPSKGYSVGAFAIYHPVDCNATCYKEEISCSNTTCQNTNQNNERTCHSVIVEDNPANPSDCDTSNKASGKKTYTLKDGVCSLYCTESGTASYPGNVEPAIKVGTNLAWPTANGKGVYPLTTSTTMTCKVEMEDDSAVTQECLNLAARATYTYSGNDAVAKLSYEDTRQVENVNLKSNCTTSSSVSGDTVVIKNACNYSLPDNKNIAVNKETLSFVDQVSTQFSSAVTNYILITKYNGVLPIGGINWSDSSISDVLFNEKYSLEIVDLPLGYGGRFTSDLNSTPYICKYKVTTSISGECKCPPGKPWSETDLYGAMKNQATTCAEAIEIYCNKDPNPYTFTCTKPNGVTVDITSCVESKKDINACKIDAGCFDTPVCPITSTHAGYAYENDNRYKACISGGGTVTACRDLICNDPPTYYCPSGTDREGMDISSCVFEYMGNGKSESEAEQICLKQCDDGKGSTIYRTISLENPFPSKNGDTTISQLGLSVGMFNDTIKGRYPGANWNSQTLVHNKILNNRGYDGSAIYNEATPLYTINLDAYAIKKIREYNKKQIDNGKGGYADFELTCTDGAYCISNFLHNSGITKADGSSILDISNSTCGRARNKSDFISCYTYR